MEISDPKVLVENDDAIVVEECVTGQSLGSDAYVVMTYYGLRDGRIAEMRHIRGFTA